MARETEELERRCARCGADALRPHAPASAGAPPPTLAARACAAVFASEARERSGLAYASGFAGIVYLFRPSAAESALEWFGTSGAAFLLVWGAAAPLAAALALAASHELDRAPWKVGRPQAVLGYLLGLSGTLQLIAEMRHFWRMFG